MDDEIVNDTMADIYALCSLARVVLAVLGEIGQEASSLDHLSTKISQVRDEMRSKEGADWLSEALTGVRITYSLRAGCRVAGLDRSLMRLEANRAIRIEQPGLVLLESRWHPAVAASLAHLRPSSRLALRSVGQSLSLAADRAEAG